MGSLCCGVCGEGMGKEAGESVMCAACVCGVDGWVGGWMDGWMAGLEDVAGCGGMVRGVADLGSWRVGWSVESVACDQGLGSWGVCGVVCMRGEWGRRLGSLWRVMRACGGWVEWDWMGLGWDGVGLDGVLGSHCTRICNYSVSTLL